VVCELQWLAWGFCVLCGCVGGYCEQLPWLAAVVVVELGAPASATRALASWSWSWWIHEAGVSAGKVGGAARIAMSGLIQEKAVSRPRAADPRSRFPSLVGGLKSPDLRSSRRSREL
jgi:hypothetical protein